MYGILFIHVIFMEETERAIVFRKRMGVYRFMKKEGNGYFWNSIAGLLNAGEAVILSMVVTRTNGLADAGILSMAFAVGNLMMAIGKFGVRSYQATDVDERFSFSDYFWARVVTVLFMAAASFGSLLYNVWGKGYGSRKATVILAVCFIYLVESVEDVFWGLYQQKYSLDTGAKLFIIRWCAILGICIPVLVFCQDLQMAVILGAAASVVISGISNAVVFPKYQQKIGLVKIGAVQRILCQCFPLFLAAFMTIYVVNAPKYAIDKYLPEEVQACYGFISMPVFVVELLNGFLYQPSLVQMALEWKEQRIDSFCWRIRRQCLLLTGLTGVCLLGARLCGIPVLSAIYGTDLSGYQLEMLVLLCGGGMLAYAGYFSVLLTIIREQKTILYGYAAISVLSLVFCSRIVRLFGVMGAAVFYTFLMGVLAGFFLLLFTVRLKHNF